MQFPADRRRLKEVNLICENFIQLKSAVFPLAKRAGVHEQRGAKRGTRASRPAGLARRERAPLRPDRIGIRGALSFAVLFFVQAKKSTTS
jgi:hypothetical protein